MSQASAAAWAASEQQLVRSCTERIKVRIRAQRGNASAVVEALLIQRYPDGSVRVSHNNQSIIVPASDIISE